MFVDQMKSFGALSASLRPIFLRVGRTTSVKKCPIFNKYIEATNYAIVVLLENGE
jgi:hypothetical protein